MQNNLGLESDCDWGVPLMNKPTNNSVSALKTELVGLKCRKESSVMRIALSNILVYIYICL